MFQNLTQLYGKKLSASDGPVGHIKDFYFDDQSWDVRYLVADTGSWLASRQVLLAPGSFGARSLGRADADADVLEVNLTRRQIEESPSIDQQRPVSRQYEEEYYRYYGWSPYWVVGGMAGMGALPVAATVSPPLAAETQASRGPEKGDDPHLRSTKEIIGYGIQTRDGSIGTVSGFMVEGWSWKIRELVVEIGHWYSGKPVLVLPADIERISYEDSTVFVNLAKTDIEQTAKNDVAQPVVPGQ